MLPSKSDPKSTETHTRLTNDLERTQLCGGGWNHHVGGRAKLGGIEHQKDMWQAPDHPQRSGLSWTVWATRRCLWLTQKKISWLGYRWELHRRRRESIRGEETLNALAHWRSRLYQRRCLQMNTNWKTIEGSSTQCTSCHEAHFLKQLFSIPVQDTDNLYAKKNKTLTKFQRISNAIWLLITTDFCKGQT